MSDRVATTPASNRWTSELFKQAVAKIGSGGYRVVLSGIGGEQPLGGGLPTPIPEFQNYLTRARFVRLGRQLNAWSAKIRKRRLPLLWDAVKGFLPLAFVGLPEHIRPVAPWFHPSFVRRNHVAFCGYASRLKVFGPLPSFQEHLNALDCERRLKAYYPLTSELLYEVRYAYLDRDLREFAYAIPREQVVGVGKRRFLMRRALVGIVPDELLNRKQKSFAPPEAKNKLPTEWPSSVEIGQRIVSSSAGIVDPDQFLEALEKARRNEDVPVGSLKRTLTLESWLRHLVRQGVLRVTPSTSLRASKHSSIAQSRQDPVKVDSSGQEAAQHKSLAS